MITLRLAGERKNQQETLFAHLKSKTISCKRIGATRCAAPFWTIEFRMVIMFYLQSDGESACSSTSSGTCHEEFPGCAYLRAIRMQMDNYQTTSGIYLETIFTHREILCAYPDAHRHCAHALSDLAYMLEKRAWRADRDSDSEAVTAFRHEAWSIAASFR